MALKTFPALAFAKSGSSLTTRVRVLEKRLGDGYTQTAADGLNAQVLTFRASFLDTKKHVATAVAFLKRHAGVTAFLFTLPDETAPRQWRCKRWAGPNWVSETHRSLSATFEEDFSL